ncbi:DUF2851 family protein [Flagellimonas okinawensis]|uniref:DUF2851 family protein n=1 Tax=Flagellimonas okinawensis TaxID=3031324 RepID=A0ABT5XQQ2_9FLAO|nr:DUF2851 family protein [[Muricauda] okinawensis]MDF0708220.1 DUF2851 family protein [[Muricauda] okinawensis]
MREDLLYFIWKHNKLSTKALFTGVGETIVIRSPGTQNRLAGPDFFNAKVEIDGQLWAGNVEMHLKSSDWYAHHHENDDNYNNVILHVVWEDDIAVFRKDGSQIPTLEIQHYVSDQILDGYHSLMQNSSSSFINCERDLKAVDSFKMENWLHRLFIERLENKSQLIQGLLKKSNNDWESVLFIMLAKNFGSKVNGTYFLERAAALDFSIVRKTSNEPLQLEALLFGHFGLLGVEDCKDLYFLQLQIEYDYICRKFNLDRPLSKPDFFGLRPMNFPTIRVSQLVNLYVGTHNLFSTLMALKGKEEIYGAFEISAGLYWEEHYTFGKVSKKREKLLSKKFIDLIIINTLLPLKFCYAKHLGKDWNEDLIALVSDLAKEDNSIIKNFAAIGSKTQNALESQAKLELYTNYCSKNKCMQCVVGTQLLNRIT